MHTGTHTHFWCAYVKFKFALPRFHDDSRKSRCRWAADQLSSCSMIITRLVIGSFRRCVDGVCVLECPPVKLDKGSNTVMTPFPNLNSNLITLHNVCHKINHINPNPCVISEIDVGKNKGNNKIKSFNQIHVHTDVVCVCVWVWESVIKWLLSLHSFKEPSWSQSPGSSCKPCPVVHPSPVCGTDGHSYSTKVAAHTDWI